LRPGWHFTRTNPSHSHSVPYRMARASLTKKASGVEPSRVDEWSGRIERTSGDEWCSGGVWRGKGHLWLGLTNWERCAHSATNCK
jgi:hypothetical protein